MHILQDVVESINDTPNRSLRGRAPAFVNPKNEEEVRLDAYLARNPPKRPPSVFKKDSSIKKRKPFTLKISETKSESPIYVIPSNGITIKLTQRKSL